MTKKEKFARIHRIKEKGEDTMDLLGTLKQEIQDKKLTNKLKIAQYIYRRTGELFEYDPLWIFSTPEEREQLRNKKLDIRDINDFAITCFSWSYIYNELLHQFGIVSRIKYVTEEVMENGETVKKPVHAYVEVIQGGRIYRADLTVSYTDMIGIKYGLNTYYNCQLFIDPKNQKNGFEDIGEDVYQKNLNVEELINNLKRELESLKKESTSREEYTYHVYQRVGEVINIIKANTGYVIGAKYIQALLKLFLGNDHLLQNTYFYNKDKSIYIAVHQIDVGKDRHYFAYEKTSDGNYEMHEINKELVDAYFMLYSYKFSKDLKSTYLNNLPRLK